MENQKVKPAVNLKPLIQYLRCPECDREVFHSSIQPETDVTCRDLGHWVGHWTEAVPKNLSIGQIMIIVDK